MNFIKKTMELSTQEILRAMGIQEWSVGIFSKHSFCDFNSKKIYYGWEDILRCNNHESGLGLIKEEQIAEAKYGNISTANVKKAMLILRMINKIVSWRKHHDAVFYKFLSNTYANWGDYVLDLVSSKAIAVARENSNVKQAVKEVKDKMRPISINLDEAGPISSPPSSGPHELQITLVSDKESKRTGNPYIELNLEVTSGKDIGKVVVDRLVTTGYAAGRLKDFLDALGIEVTDHLDIDQLVNRKVVGVVSRERFNGRIQARIDKYFPANGKVAS